MLARPDPSTFELLPWVADDEASGTMFCDITNLDGTPFAGDPRQVLRRNIDQARSLDNLIKKNNQKISCALSLEADRDTIIKRLLGLNLNLC